MVSPTVKNNRRLSLSLMQATPSHTLVPIASLSSSPTSSTGSASVLEWNSNSDGEFLQISSPATLTAPLSPALFETSPVHCTLPLADDRLNTPPSDQDGSSHSTWGTSIDNWTPLFDGLMPPAPISSFDSATPTALDDSVIIQPQSLETEMDKMCNEFEQSFWLDAYAKLGIRPESMEDDGLASGESPEQSTNASQDTSMTSTVIAPQSPSAPPTAMTTPAATETDAPATQSPLVSESLFITPVAMSTESSMPTFPIKEENEPETISIAEYFQRKALSAEEAAPRGPPTPLEEPPRPESVNSALSYFTQPQSPSQNSENSFSAGRPIHVSTINNEDRNSDAESEVNPPRHSLISTPIPRMDDLLTRTTNHRSPFIGHFPGLFSPRSPGLFGPPSPSMSPSPSEQEIRSPLAADFPLASAESPSPYTSRSSSPQPPVPRIYSPYSLDTGIGLRLNRVSSPEFPRRSTDLGSPIIPPYSPEFPRRDLPVVYEMDDSDTRNLPSVRSWLKLAKDAMAKEDAPTATLSDRPPLPRLPVDPVQSKERSDSPIPNIPSWLVNSVKSQQLPAINGTSASKSRPPLPPVPKPDVTPQFALRSEFGKIPEQRTDYYASALPSSWGCSLPPAPWDSNLGRDASVPGWGFNPPPQPPIVDWRVPPSPATTDNEFHYQDQLSRHEANQTQPIDVPYPAKRSLSNPYPSSNRPIPDPPKPYYAPYYGAAPNPQYTGSTLPKDQKLHAPPPPTWPVPRRLRFAPLPPTPNYRPAPPPVIPPYQAAPSPYSNFNYLYQTPAPVIPPVSAPPMPPAMHSPNSFPTSKKYWFSDANVVFRVENCLYRVHRHFFERHSGHLSKMLMTYWYSPMNHLFLPNVKKVEFERMLSIFYPSDLTKSDITTVAGWTSILELGNKWDMTQVKALAIQKLGPITSAVEKIAIAKKHGILDHDWLIPAYTELCARRAPLSLDEAEDLDLATVIKIWEVQHAILGLTCNCCDDDKITELVKEKFGFVDEAPFVDPNW